MTRFNERRPREGMAVALVVIAIFAVLIAVFLNFVAVPIAAHFLEP